MVTDDCRNKINKLSGDELAAVGALRRVGDKTDEYACPLCNNGGNGNNNATGIKPYNAGDHTGWKCHRCGEKFNNIRILAEHYGLNSKYDFKEVCQRACDDFGIIFEEDSPLKPTGKNNKQTKIKTNQQGDYNMIQGKSKATAPNSDVKLIYSSEAQSNSEPNDATTKIRNSELGIINQQLATDENALKNFVETQGGTWRGLPFELLKKKGCRFIKDWIHPAVLAKRPDAQKFATPSPRVLVPASTNSNNANYLARLTVPIENFTKEQRKYIREKDHAGQKTLFNIEVLKNAKEVFAVEGYIDAMSIELAGFNAVAFGSASGYELLVKAVATLEKKPRIIILLDSDETGREHAPKLQRALAKIGCHAVIQFLFETDSKIDANQILVEDGVDYLMNALFAIQQEAQKEFKALEEKTCADDQNEIFFDGDSFLEGLTKDLDNARRLIKFLPNNFRWLTDDEHWLTFENGIWKRRSDKPACLYPYTAQFSDNMVEFAKILPKESDEQKKAYSIGFAFREAAVGTINMLKACEEILITAEDLNRHKNLFCVQNGVIDLQTGKLYPFDAKYLITNQAAVAFEEKVDTYFIRNFLSQVLPDEETLRSVLRYL
ncbi:MAG: toprim domain-containing protein, partial [Selenomonadaceae bacterium]|nr:toprim domain-containing protein [Selenomonadaceae bacterium]